ncbi:MAG TPA: hypothetical protein VKO20_08540 [Desulfosalsimonadaceae bacterium]|nr:hypothetical protein [Desulfosalsimonadaceae bacterium]
MDAKSYCDTVNNQLTGWKATIYDAILATQKLQETDKDKVQPVLDSLNGIVSELNKSLEQLRTECPADWSPQKQTIENKLGELKTAFEQLSEKMDAVMPDTTAWV